MKPTIGRIVTRLNEDGTVSLKVFYNTWVGDVHDARFSETPLTRGCWNWPPREA